MSRRPTMNGWFRATFDSAMATATGPTPERRAAAERAHILSQPWPWRHTRTHGVMLRLAMRDRDLVEIAGQLVRLVVAAPGSLTGRYPDGNTGRARVGIRTPMPVPADIAALLADAGVRLGPADDDTPGRATTTDRSGP
ncbi:uncharacterized protein DUF3703 [Stackebrandtia albiflava]|uniref:Uncharacterized protein DUF3703 n=2 Tax=Stackebrandtia albiflava TaxID=406432 RepID=A0A562VDX0_9ACTN|nr:DUF3703 domain-containing protein [Stackebrandtia albiflava]TWJ16079.1 uncharacterized protein DUF3703 [Stackebrandtia albiflava]